MPASLDSLKTRKTLKVGGKPYTYFSLKAAEKTLGSLAGTWGTAFFLLTWMGSVRLVAVLGAVQVSLGFLWWWR